MPLNLRLLFAAMLGSMASATVAGELGEIEINDDWTFRYGTLLHLDTVLIDDDVTPLTNDTDFRRARIRTQLRGKDWRFRADYGFGVAEGWRSTFVEYSGFRRQRIIVGNHVAPFSMEDLKGSSQMGMIERSIAGALSPSVQNGISWRTWRDNWSLHAGVFGNALDSLDRRRLPGRSVMARGTYAPINRDGFAVHLGGAIELRNIDSGKSVLLRSRPGTRLTKRRLVDTRRIGGVDSSRNIGLEFGLAYDRFRLQAEMIRMALDAPGGTLNFASQYVMGSYTFGARPYRYSHSRGNFRSVRPDADWGSLEVLVRAASLDLNDGSITGGKQRELTVGASWIYNDYLRFRLALTDIDASPNRNGIDESVTLTTLRVQFAF